MWCVLINRLIKQKYGRCIKNKHAGYIDMFAIRQNTKKRSAKMSANIYVKDRQVS